MIAQNGVCQKAEGRDTLIVDCHEACCGMHRVGERRPCARRPMVIGEVDAGLPWALGYCYTYTLKRARSTLLSVPLMLTPT